MSGVAVDQPELSYTGEESSTTTLETYLGESAKVTHMLILCPRNSTPRYIIYSTSFLKHTFFFSQKAMYKNVGSSIHCNSLKREKPKRLSTAEWTDQGIHTAEF